MRSHWVYCQDFEIPHPIINDDEIILTLGKKGRQTAREQTIKFPCINNNYHRILKEFSSDIIPLSSWALSRTFPCSSAAIPRVIIVAEDSKR